MSFKDKTVLITGAASGMGLLSAKCFAEAGANVVMLDVNEAAVQEKADKIRQKGGSAVAFKTDVRSYENVCAAVDFAAKKFTRIDIVVNCAGGSACRIWNRPRDEEFKDIPIEVFDWGLDVNLKGPFYMGHAVMKYMTKQKSGVIINIGSVTGEEGSPTGIDYAAAKSAVMYGLTKSLALYGGPYGIRCICISPGPVLTRPEMANMPTLLKRAADPQEIVDLIMYVASNKATFMTGINIFIDGGRIILKDKGDY